MADLLVVIRSVAIYMRHASSLKDKRQIVRSIVQKLKNEGFSATEYGQVDDPKRALIGFSLVDGDAGFIESQIEKSQRFFVGDFEILECKTKRETLAQEDLSDGLILRPDEPDR